MRRAFTLIELLVVITIIAILMGLLIPGIGYVRRASHVATTQSLLAELQGAIERYHMDYRAYPGIFATETSGVRMDTMPNTDPRKVHGITGSVTMSEGLVLSLLGGLERNTSTGLITYNPALVGTGARWLPASGANVNKAKTAYLDAVNDLSTVSPNIDRDLPNFVAGHYKDAAGEANDSNLPEFVDRFPSPMPIIYLRARVGAANVSHFVPDNNPPVVIGDTGNIRNSSYGRTDGTGQYDLSQYFGYVGSFTGAWPALAAVPLDDNDMPRQVGLSIGVGKDVEYWYGPIAGGNAATSGPFSPDEEVRHGRGIRHGLVSLHQYAAGNVGDPNAEYPLGAETYFRNPAFGAVTGPDSLQNQPRAKDAYILISPGPDRVYGTADDITSFGAVMP